VRLAIPLGARATELLTAVHSVRATCAPPHRQQTRTAALLLFIAFWPIAFGWMAGLTLLLLHHAFYWLRAHLRSADGVALGRLAGHPLLCGDRPLSAMLAVGPSVSLVIHPQGCRGSAVVLHFEPGDLVVWRYDLVHGGFSSATNETSHGTSQRHRRAAAAADDRIHVHIDTPAYDRQPNHTDNCGDVRKAPIHGFEAADGIAARADALATSTISPLQVLDRRGIVVLPSCGALRDLGARALEAAPPMSMWGHIYNGLTANGDEDRSRRVWCLTGERKQQIEDGFSSALREAGVLQCDPRGPWAGGTKTIAEATALRCLPGCPAQPPHADISKGTLHYDL
jgi:hypothetical protein